MNDHSSLGIGELSHELLRRIYNKAGHGYPTVGKRFIQKVAVKAMNGTIIERGLVPSRFVLGIIPRFPILNINLSKQGERMDIIKKSQAEMNNIIAEKRVLAALTRNIQPAADMNWGKKY